MSKETSCFARRRLLGGEPFSRVNDAELAKRDEETAADDANCRPNTSLADDIDAIETFADTLVVKVAPSLEAYDKAHAGIVHRLGMEISEGSKQ
jgi:hypothetical protein